MRGALSTGCYVVVVSWLFCGLGSAAVFVLRRKRPDLERPCRAFGYPLLPAVFTVFSAVLLLNTPITDPRDALVGLGITGVGIPVSARGKSPPHPHPSGKETGIHPDSGMRGALPTGRRPESLPRFAPPSFAGRENPPHTPPRRRCAPRPCPGDFLHSLVWLWFRRRNDAPSGTRNAA